MKYYKNINYMFKFLFLNCLPFCPVDFLNSIVTRLLKANMTYVNTYNIGMITSTPLVISEIYFG